MPELRNVIVFAVGAARYAVELRWVREVVTLGRTQVLPVLAEVAGRLEERADAVGVDLRVEGNSRAEVPLRPRMLRVVAENLAVNALRYAGDGATCTLSVEREGDVVVLRAADDGAGVSEEDLAEAIRDASATEKVSRDGQSLSAAVAGLERQMIVTALEKSHSNQQHAARLLGLSRQGLLNKIKRYAVAVQHS